MPIAPLLPSGVAPVDAAWGGLARPGAYLLVGSAGQGRLDLSTRIVGAGAGAGEPTLLFSGREPGAILSVARQAGVDLAGAGDLVQLKGVPLGAQLASLGEEGLTRMLQTLADSAAGASRVVVEDFTPFVRFRSFEAFGEAFRRLVRAVCDHDSTLVLGLGEPANDGSRRLLDFVEGVVTGTLRVAAGGKSLQLIPGTGHTGEEKDVPWTREVTGAAPSPPPTLATELLDHEADGYGGSDPAAFDAGALVVSTVPSEPFGYPAAVPTPMPAPFGPDSLPDDLGEPDGPITIEPPRVPSAGDGQVWATIQPVSATPTEAPASYDPDVLAGGFLIDSNDPSAIVPHLSPYAPPALAEVAPAAPEPPRMTPSPVMSPIGDPDFGPSDPEAGFTDDLTQAFAAGANAPFLVVALRIERGNPFFDSFPAVADGLLGALSGRDRALVRDDEARMVVLLPDAPEGTPQRLLGAVRTHLETLVGARADEALRSVAVLVLPNGQPFTDAAGVLGYVLG